MSYPQWCNLIARFVAPLFVFMLVEGFFHTHNSRKDYLFRIIGATAITWIEEILINIAFHNVDPLTHKMTVYSILEGNNILVTLAIFLGLIWSLELFRENKKRWYYLLLAIILGNYLLKVDYIFYQSY